MKKYFNLLIIIMISTIHFIGLAIISSIPNNLRFRNEFNIGTKEPVIVYYTATCCLPKVEIIATDLRGNTHKKTIDAEKRKYCKIITITYYYLLKQYREID